MPGGWTILPGQFYNAEKGTMHGKGIGRSGKGKKLMKEASPPPTSSPSSPHAEETSSSDEEEEEEELVVPETQQQPTQQESDSSDVEDVVDDSNSGEEQEEREEGPTEDRQEGPTEPTERRSKGPNKEPTSNEGDTQTTTKPTKRKRRIHEAYNFTPQQEEALVDCLQENQMLFDKRHPQFKNSQKKAYLFYKEGATLDPPATMQQVCTWITSMRTAYGRLSHPDKGVPSGSSQQRSPTPWNKWIKEQFSFILPGIEGKAVESSTATLKTLTRVTPSAASTYPMSYVL